RTGAYDPARLHPLCGAGQRSSGGGAGRFPSRMPHRTRGISAASAIVVAGARLQRFSGRVLPAGGWGAAAHARHVNRRTAMTDIANPNPWPELPALADWQKTVDTVHMWSQIVGKI